MRRDYGFYFLCRNKPLRQVIDGAVAWVGEGPGGWAAWAPLEEPQLCVDRGGASSISYARWSSSPQGGYSRGWTTPAGLGKRGRPPCCTGLCWSSGRGSASPRAWLCSESFARIPRIFPTVVRGGSITTSTSQVRKCTERLTNLPKVTQVRRNGVRICTQDIELKLSGREGGREVDRGQQKGRWPEKKNWGEGYFILTLSVNNEMLRFLWSGKLGKGPSRLTDLPAHKG